MCWYTTFHVYEALCFLLPGVFSMISAHILYVLRLSWPVFSSFPSARAASMNDA
jgi:hypothetical protein